MGKVKVDSLYLSNIANSIRTKLGSQTKFKPSEMAGAIDSIPTGGGGNVSTLLALGLISKSSTANYVNHPFVFTSDGKIVCTLSLRGTIGVDGKPNYAFYGHRFEILNKSKTYRFTCTIKALSTPEFNVSANQYYGVQIHHGVGVVKPTTYNLPTELNQTVTITEDFTGEQYVWVSFRFDNLLSTSASQNWYNYNLVISLEEIT